MHGEHLACGHLGNEWTDPFPLNGNTLPWGFASHHGAQQPEFSLSGVVRPRNGRSGSGPGQLAEASADPLRGHAGSLKETAGLK